MAPSFTDLLSYLFHFVARAKLEAFLVEGTTFLVEHIHLAEHFRKKVYFRVRQQYYKVN